MELRRKQFQEHRQEQLGRDQSLVLTARDRLDDMKEKTTKAAHVAPIFLQLALGNRWSNVPQHPV